MQYTITVSERELALLIASVADKYKAAEAALEYVRDNAGAIITINRFCTELRNLNGRLIETPPDS